MFSLLFPLYSLLSFERVMKPLWQAMIFLTVFPTPEVDWERGDLGRAAAFFPFVGLLIGLVLLGAWWGIGLVLPELVTAVLVVVLWAVLTGGLHLDGLADCGDGLLAAVSIDRRLEILKDSRIGAFGAITLVLHLFLKVVAVASIASPIALLLAPIVGRWLILPTAKRPLARPGGMGAEFADTLSSRSIWFGAVLPVVFAAVIGISGVWALCLPFLLTGGIWRLAKNRLGGITGDVFGLVVELAETVVLLSLIATLG